MSERIAKPKFGLVLFAHGSRDPRWKIPFEEMEKRISLRLPNALVKAAFLQDCEPNLFDVIDQMVTSSICDITVTPMFLAVGAHSRNDFPKIAEKLRSTHTDVTFTWTEVIGQWEETLESLSTVVANRFN